MSNLPPGVNTSMLPGNRPSDAAYDALEEALESICSLESSDTVSNLTEFVWNMIQRTHDDGYKLGLEEARATDPNGPETQTGFTLFHAKHGYGKQYPTLYASSDYIKLLIGGKLNHGWHIWKVELKPIEIVE